MRVFIIAAILLCSGIVYAKKYQPFFDSGRATQGIIWILKDEGTRRSDYRFTWAGEMGRIIAEKSRDKGVDIDAMVTLAFTESSFNMDAVGLKGESGMYQLYKKYADEANKRRDKYEANVEIGARRLAIAIRVCTKRGTSPATWEEVYGHYRSSYCNPRHGEKKAKLLRRLKAALNAKRTRNNKTSVD